MRKKIYRAVTAATSAACLVMAFFSWYVVGVVEKDNIKEILESRVEYISETLYKKEIQYKSVSDTISDEYKSRARALAVMLSENPDIIQDELQLEELRMMIGAEAISFYDENMHLEISTGSFYDESTFTDIFSAGTTNKLFSSAEIDVSGDIPRIIVGCSRLDKSGVIQLEYISENVETLLKMMNISDIFAGVPILRSGSVALIDNETMNYIAHTDENMIGKPSHFNLHEDFFGKEAFFDCEINGEDVLLHFDFCNNQLVIGYIPYSEIYATRNDIILWVVSAAVIISGVVMLTIRSKILHISKKDKRKNQIQI
ncbi:MAG: hypothetical protein IJA12_02925 [Oscillospiraceae bacterium]|nr:hypothetical protein [Oscillospiraceae bacterium]